MSTDKVSDGAGDPHLWLETISGPLIDDWVTPRNAATRAAMVDAVFEGDLARIREVLDRDDKIPFARIEGRTAYNLWRDAKNPRGLWRRTPLASYTSAATVWESLIDFDALGESEGKALVYSGADFLSTRSGRALVRISPGGGDAAEVREFDLRRKAFVEGGFHLPVGKGSAAWINRDTMAFTLADTPGETTASSYPRHVRILKRGQKLAEADTVFGVEGDDLGVFAAVHHRQDGPWLVFSRWKTFEETVKVLQKPDGTRITLDIPDNAQWTMWGDWLAVKPKADWEIGGKVVPSGALAVMAFDRFLAGAREADVIFTPSGTVSLSAFITTRKGFVLGLLDHVKSTIVAVKHGPEGWRTRPVPGLPVNATIHASPFADTKFPNIVASSVALTTTGFATPTSLAIWPLSGMPRTIKSEPALYDSRNVEVVQHEVRADDGTMIPYFLVGSSLSEQSAPRPTVLYGYGGFNLSMMPWYSAAMGRLWLERGYNFALANIRGGGEFGPTWHEAARGRSKHVSHDDFAAVARALVTRGTTTPAMLGCLGGSNGGLLVGNMLTRYPELFGAIVCQVPLLDMARYARLLAGASWVAEYGDPDDPAQWPFIKAFSPYHMATSEHRYPPVLIMTNRTDDRVHPGHARKMAALLETLGQQVSYHEHIVGGHGGGADNALLAETMTLTYAFFRKNLCVS